MPTSDAMTDSRLYAELRRVARRVLNGVRPDSLLQPTALVNEAFVRIGRRNGAWNASPERIAAAIGEMRRAMLDALRAERAQKRGGGLRRVTLDTSLLDLPFPQASFEDLHQALEQLATLSARQARVVELRFFGGLSEDEIADVLSISRRTVQIDWRGARAWLRRELARSSPSDGEMETGETPESP